MVREMIDHRDELGIGVAEQEHGATCVDCGVRVAGSCRAGTLFVGACLGELATTAITLDRVGTRRSRFCTSWFIRLSRASVPRRRGGC